jgi:hypothetical protein
MKTQRGQSLFVILAAVLGASCVLSASAQTFKNVPVQGGGSLVQVSAGGTSVWGLDTHGNPYIYQAGQFVSANNVSLTQIAVGGGNSLQVDEVWAVDASGRIYIASPLEVEWQFLQVPGSLAQIAVGVGYSKCHPYEVWGINGSSQIYRYNSCTGQFEQIAGLLKQLSVGGGDVWGINDSKQIFRFDPQTSTFKQLPGLLSQIAVGVDGVWGINASQIYQFDPSTGHFVQLRGSLTQITAGGNGVWGINTSSQIFRFDPGSQLFTQAAPGSLATISVGTGGDVWGVNASNQVYAFAR